MYVKLNPKIQKKIIRKSIKKAGAYRKLARMLNIPRSTLTNYIKSDILPEERFNKIIKFLDIKDSEKLILEKLDKNWKQIKGGKMCVESKKKKGNFKNQLEKARINSAKKLKEWHKIMKKEKPEEYYHIQYNNFKKIGEYKFQTEKGEKVRNILEKQIADILNKMNIEYKYEPLIKSNNKYFFPDFLINKNIIIECTMWRGETKAYQLKEKIKHLGKSYKVFVVIPKTLYSYYKILDNHLIKGLDEFVPIAQTFLAVKR